MISIPFFNPKLIKDCIVSTLLSFLICQVNDICKRQAFPITLGLLALMDNSLKFFCVIVKERNDPIMDLHFLIFIIIFHNSSITAQLVVVYLCICFVFNNNDMFSVLEGLFNQSQSASTSAIMWAYVPPYLPAFAIMPMALVFSIHCFTDRMKRLSPAMFLIPSNSGELKFGLYIPSQMPRNSMDQHSTLLFNESAVAFVNVSVITPFFWCFYLKL